MLNQEFIYLFNRLEVLKGIVRPDNIIQIYQDSQTNEFEKVSFELPVDYPFSDVFYFGLFDIDDTFRIYKIDETRLGETLYIEGRDKADSDLGSIGIIKDKRPNHVTAGQALTVALEGTGYQVGHVTDLPDVASLNYYYISPREALVKIVETFNCEFRVRYTFANNRITGRHIDLAKRFGKPTGRQFLYGENILELVEEESSDSVVTALIGRGKGEQLDSGGYGRRLEFSDISWSKSSGDPIDKPIGQNYLALEDARKKYGLSQDGRLHHRWAVFVDESIEDKAVLLQRTWEKLKSLSMPARTYKVNLGYLPYDVQPGDSVAIIHDDLHIALEARVLKVHRDRLNTSLSTVELGDYNALNNRKSSVNDFLRREFDERFGESSEFTRQLEEVYRRIEIEKRTRNEEIDEKFRLAEIELNNAKELAELKAQQTKSELESKINSEIKPLANETKQLADRANQSSTSQAQEMERLRTTLADNKREVLAEVNQTLDRQVNEFAESLTDDINRVRFTLDQARSDIYDQANAQRGLSSRVTTVEETANGTKTTVTELQKTVNATTGNLESVSRRTRTVEDNLSGLITKFENIRVGGTNLIRGGREMKLASGGWAYGAFRKSGNGTVETITVSDSPVVGLTKGIRAVHGSNDTGITQDTFQLSEGEYTFSVWVKGEVGQKIDIRTWWSSSNVGANKVFTISQQGWQKYFVTSISRLSSIVSIGYVKTVGGGQIDILAPKLERGNVATDWSDYDEDYLFELATYKQTVDRNFAELTRTTQTVSDRATEYKSAFDQTAERFRTSISALEVFKNNEGARESRYLSLSREETARQLQTVRSDITRDYVSKSQLTETTRGIEQRFERLRVGSVNLFRNSDFSKNSDHWFILPQIKNENGVKYVTLPKVSFKMGQKVEVEAGEWYTVSCYARKKADDINNPTLSVKFDKLHNSLLGTVQIVDSLEWQRYVFSGRASKSGLENIYFLNSNKIAVDIRQDIQIERGTIVSDYRPSDLDRQSEFAEYKNTVDRQLSELSSTINTNNSAFTTFKNSYERTAQGVTEKLTALEAYKNNEHLRSNAYFEASKTETAKQLQTLRTAISENYVAKSTYEENAESITRRFEKLNEALSDKVSSSTFTQKFDEILGRVQTLDGEVMKTSSFTINENGIVLQAGRTFDGRTIASLLTVNDDNIKAITDRMIITPNNENLVKGEYRTQVIVNARDTQVSEWHTFEVKAGDEFYFEADITKLDANSNYDLKAMVTTVYKEGGYDATRVIFAPKNNAHNHKITCQATVVIPNRNKTVQKFRIGLQEETSSNFTRYRVENLKIYKKTSASLIVDGSITGRHIKANSIETGNFKGGSVTTTVLAANAVTAEKMLVNQAMINKLMTDDLLARAITASELFATSVQAVDISATRVTSGILASRNGAVSFNLDGSSLVFNHNAEIAFNSTNNVLYRSKDDGTFTAFLQFKDATYAEDPNGSIWATLGVTSSGDGINGLSRGRFAGIRTIRSTRGKGYHGTEYNARLKDQVEIIGDHTIIGHGANTDTGFFFEASKMPGVISMNKLYSTVVALRNMWVHFRNAGAGLQDVIKNRSSREANADWDMMFQDLRR